MNKFLFIAFVLSALSAQALVLGEFTGVGRYEDNYLTINNCDVAVNVNYNESEKVLTYDYASLCMSEQSYPLNAPSNDYTVRLKVDKNNNLLFMNADGSLSGPIGTKSDNEFKFSFEVSHAVVLKWIPVNLRAYMRANYGSCFESEKIQMEKQISYRFVLNRNRVTFERASITDMLPYFITRRCSEKNISANGKYQVTTKIQAELSK
ncbi:MAG: hypothetical protein H7328_00070 [Bdellovibrio sp.]|nr:hypothetical protein [Bdellovibrio sp.]